MELSYESFYLLQRKELNTRGGETPAQQRSEDKKEVRYNSLRRKKNIIIFPEERINILVYCDVCAKYA